MCLAFLSERPDCKTARHLVSHALDGDHRSMPHGSAIPVFISTNCPYIHFIVRQTVRFIGFSFVISTTIRLIQSATGSNFMFFSRSNSKTSNSHRNVRGHGRARIQWNINSRIVIQCSLSVALTSIPHPHCFRVFAAVPTAAYCFPRRRVCLFHRS